MGNCKLSVVSTVFLFLVLMSIFTTLFCSIWCKFAKTCCWAKKVDNTRIQMEETKFEQDRQRRREEAEERKKDRRKRMDMIRSKYGLAPSNPYQVMDDDASTIRTSVGGDV